MSAAPLFSLRGVSFAYERKPVLRCADLDIAEGQATAFIGPNGSGKTSLLKLLNGLIGPYHGSLRFLGQELRDSGLLRKRCIYLHQHPVMFAGSVRENIAYPLKLRRVERQRALARADELAAGLGLQALLDRQANRLSGGETQRVALARALIAGADVMLLDEPSSSMDEESAERLRAALLSLKSQGITLIFSAHDRELVSSLADRALLFSNGTIEESL